MKNIRIFYLKNFIFLVMKFSVYLNRHVFVMCFKGISLKDYNSIMIYFQWFGNMVTMKWWDDLWLNEGFASTLMYFAMDHVNPDWKVVSR